VSRLFKIAPGEGARFWNSDCLPQGIICVGWDAVGDLRGYADFPSFRKAFEAAYLKLYKGRQSTVTIKAKELWTLRDLQPGDLIAANRGIREILAVGEVLAPGYIWDPSRPEFQHTVKVRWDESRSGRIEPIKRWTNITVEPLSGPLSVSILGLQRKVSKEDFSGKTKSQSNMNPTNLILYGPPGTGKTFRLQQLQADYTDSPKKEDRDEWLRALVSTYGWRAVIAATLDAIGPSKAPKVREHELIKAKAQINKREVNLIQTLWTNLMSHTPEDVKTVLVKGRRAPFIFTKTKDSVWSLLKAWEENDTEAAELTRLYRAGPVASSPSIKRFRQVTFHPSFSYEDFIRGIRPVAT
jgi:hypothetical protein